MSGLDVHKATVEELVDRFAAICVGQNDALELDEISKFNRLFREMISIENELRSRPGDQRKALLPLLNHRDIQVRLQAAKMTLAIAPGRARQVIEAIAASNWYPQAGDAGMCHSRLDSGEFVPD